MSLPDILLDDLTFQNDIIDEVVRRVPRYCPEWTELNMSDPGRMLIEAFAWMTTMQTYRLNQVPDKHHRKLLELIGVELQPAHPARVELTFWLAAPFPLNPDDKDDPAFAIIERGTEVATVPLGNAAEEIIFTTSNHLVITKPKLVQLRRDLVRNQDKLDHQDRRDNFYPELAKGKNFEPFGASPNRPQPGDAFYVGLNASQGSSKAKGRDGQEIAAIPKLSGAILQLEFFCDEKGGLGIKPEDPPWVWSYLQNGEWKDILPSTRYGETDSTGGLNYADGRITFYLPLDWEPGSLPNHGDKAYWLRCKLVESKAFYDASPIIKDARAFTIGNKVLAEHASTISNELLGISTGEAGQNYQLQYTPVMPFSGENHVEIETGNLTRNGQPEREKWRLVDDFASSGPSDKHYSLDLLTGEISFGPAIRQPDGRVRHYGRVPETGRAIYVNEYRYGGGAKGNVPRGRLQMLKSAQAYIARVSNLESAFHGRDTETIDEAKMRARRLFRTMSRAVTAEDFEFFTRQVPGVARVRCNPMPNTLPGIAELIVVPRVDSEIVRIDDLLLTSQLKSAISTYLDRYRLITVTPTVRTPSYLAVKITASVAADSAQANQVREQALDALHHFLTPLATSGDTANRPLLGDWEQSAVDSHSLSIEARKNTWPVPLAKLSAEAAHWEGWEFGRNLNIFELHSILQRIPGVKAVTELKVETADAEPGKSLSGQGWQNKDNVRVILLQPDQLIVSGEHTINIEEIQEVSRT